MAIENITIQGNEVRVVTDKMELEAILKHRHSLSTFITLNFVLPIFYEENINPDLSREYFCLFFDRVDRKFKVLSYVTSKFSSESSYGVVLSKLLEHCKVVEKSEDFKELALKSHSFFAKEHNLAMEELFRGCSISGFMRNLYRVLQRCAAYPKSASIDGRGDIKLFKATPLIKADYYSYRVMNVPICKDIRSLRDILGKASTLGRLPTTRVMMYDNYDVVGFSDINFIRTANALHSQYKLKHRIYDYFVDGMQRLKGMADELKEKLRN